MASRRRPNFARHPKQATRGANPIVGLSGSIGRTPFWQRWRGLLCALALTAGILVVYGAVIRFDFLNFDDSFYITGNPHVCAGLTWSGLTWALHSTEAANWHPVTWISHMLDCQLFGAKAGGHHLTSVLLHLVNACLLFVLMMRMTGTRARSFVIAGLFAWHPLHVES